MESVRLAYDTVAENYASHFPDTAAEAPDDRAMIDAFAAAVTAGADRRVLDAGCGTGRISRYLAGRDCLMEGIDLSASMVAVARREQPGVTFAVGSLTDLPFPDRHFPGVLLWYSIIHTPPAGQARIFDEAVRVLRPGGHLLVGFQAGEGIRDVAPAYRRFGQEIELERYLYTADQVAAELTTRGLDVLRRMVRPARENERDDHAALLARSA